MGTNPQWQLTEIMSLLYLATKPGDWELGLLGFIPCSVTFLSSWEPFCAPYLAYKIGRNLRCFTGGLQGFIHPCSQDISGALGRISQGKKYYGMLLQPAMVQDSFPLDVPAWGLSAWTESQIKVCFTWLQWGLLPGRRGAGAKLGRKHQFPATQQRCSAVKLCLSAIFLLAARLQLKASLQPVN